jgi:hypothetical protein
MPFLVASRFRLSGATADRVICKMCKLVDEHPNPHHLRLVGIDPEEVKKRPVYKGRAVRASTPDTRDGSDLRKCSK